MVIKTSVRGINKKIEKCRRLKIPDRVIECLGELLKNTNNGMVAYELGIEYEKKGDKKKAFICYDQAESLFEDPNYKNMAQAAINNLVIEEIIAGKKKGMK